MDRAERRRQLRYMLARATLPEYLQPYATDSAFGFEVPQEVYEYASKHTSRPPSPVSDAAYFGLRLQEGQEGTKEPSVSVLASTELESLRTPETGSQGASR